MIGLPVFIRAPSLSRRVQFSGLTRQERETSPPYYTDKGYYNGMEQLPAHGDTVLLPRQLMNRRRASPPGLLEFITGRSMGPLRGGWPIQHPDRRCSSPTPSASGRRHLKRWGPCTSSRRGEAGLHPSPRRRRPPPPQSVIRTRSIPALGGSWSILTPTHMRKDVRPCFRAGIVAGHPKSASGSCVVRLLAKPLRICRGPKRICEGSRPSPCAKY